MLRMGKELFLYKNDRVLCTEYHARIVQVCTLGRLDCGCRLGSNNTRRALKKEKQTSRLWQTHMGYVPQHGLV